MGNSGLGGQKENEILERLYTLYKKGNPSVAGGAEGGDCCSMTGGYSALEDYGNSIFSKAKETLIRNIASDVSEALKVKKDYAMTAPIKDVIASFKKMLPDPKSKKLIKDSENLHKMLCSRLAKSINKRYDMDIIDEDASPAVVCKKVSELLHSLFTGLHTEFLTVAGDVQRIVNNLRVLKSVVDGANKKIMDDLAKSGDGAVTEHAENMKSLYAKLSEEINRQHAILANLLDSVIGPLGSSLTSMLVENDDFVGLTEDLKDLAGTEYFGEKLSYLLSGVGDVAQSADLVDKALKQIGLSVSDYKKVKDLKELKEKIYGIMVSKKLSSQELHKMLAAAEMLYKNDLAHDDIAEFLSKKGGANYQDFNASYADMADEMTHTYDESPFKGRTQSKRKSISTQIYNKEKYRKQLFISFNEQVRDRYRKIIYSIGLISKKIGQGIEHSPELDLFIKTLKFFAASQPDKQNLHVALSGFRKDVNSSYIKYKFLENLISLSDCLESLSQGSNGKVFASLKAEIKDLIVLVNQFNDSFAKALSEIHVEPLRPAVGGVSCDAVPSSSDDSDSELDMGEEESTADEVAVSMGGDDFEISDLSTLESVLGGSGVSGGFGSALGGVVSSMSEEEFSHFKTMKKSIREIFYYYRISGIKKNMLVTAKEFASNTSNYENILGEEAGYIIDKIQLKYNNLLKGVDGNETPVLTAEEIKSIYSHDYTTADASFNRKLHENIADMKYHTAADIGAVAAAGVAAVIERKGKEGKEIMKDYVSGYKFLLEYMRSSKIEMLEAAQALDLYLSKFTKEAQLKADEIKQFVQILEQIEIVAKFFTDKSGDNFSGVFEAFESGNVRADMGDVIDFANLMRKNNNPNIKNKLGESNFEIESDHYYEEFEVPAAGHAAAALPGKFYCPRLLTRIQAINLVKQIEKSIKSVRALENIIATFSRVNISVSDDVKTFMSSGMMFKAFMKYCVASVISLGVFTVGPNPIGAPAVNTITANLFADADPTVADLKSVFGKMAVGLRFNKERVRLTTDTDASGTKTSTDLVLCDPLKVVDSSIMKKHDVCDKIFEMSIKSIISKIFVVVGSYTLFNKPAKDQRNTFSSSINPLRQILGGSAGGSDGGMDSIKIIPEASELYIRLPLLAEWYRNVFSFNLEAQPANAPNPLVSMIPDMDGVWGDLCKVIFLDAMNIQDGSYPLEFARKIIESINSIYASYISKDKNMSCKDMLMEFVLEINRRYGFIMRSEITKYLGERYKYIDDNGEYPDEDRVDYDLLDVNSSLGRKPAPSDRFRSFAKQSNKSRTQSLEDFYESVIRFRQSIESNLILDEKSSSDEYYFSQAEVSLSGIVAETEKKLKNSSSADEKYKIVYDHLHGIEKFGDIDQEKLLIFHETVITPLTSLYFVYLILNDYNKFATSLNAPDDFKNNFYNSLPAAGAETSFAKKLITYVNSKFKGDDNPYKQRDVAVPPVARVYTANLESIMDEKSLNGYLTDYADAKTNFIPEGYMHNDHQIRCDFLINGTNNEVENEKRQRFMFQNSKVMETLLRKLMNIGCDMNGLTEIYFAGAGSANKYPVLNYEGLEKACSALFENAKSSLSQLRKFIPNRLVASIEDFEIETRENRISLFYIQEHLFDRLFKNKYGNGLVDAGEGVKNIWKVLTKQYSFNGLLTAAAPIRPAAPAAPAAPAPAGLPPVAALYADAAGVDLARAIPIPAVGPPNSNLVNIDAQLLEDLKFNSFNSVFSKLCFWDTSMDDSRLEELFGLRTIVRNQKHNSFPAKFAPVLKSGNSIGNSVGKERDAVNSVLSGSMIADRNINDINSFDEKSAIVIDLSAVPAGAAAAVLEQQNVAIGVHNLYDFDDKYDNQREYKCSDVRRFQSDSDKTKSNAAGRAAIDEKLHEKLGLIPKLNNIIYKYMNMFLDNSSKKIYKPLIEKFANGHNAKDILQGKNINDRVLYNNTAGAGAAEDLYNYTSAICDTEPTQGAVLFASLANGIKGVATLQSERATSGNVPAFLEENFANISEYQKELMRAYLPAFEKELELLAKKSEFIRRCLDETQVKVHKFKSSMKSYTQLALIGNNLDSNVNYTQANYIPNQNATEAYNSYRKSYLIGLCDDISMSSKSLLKCVKEVQKELNDVPLYGETYQESLIDYSNRNGKMPLTPISHVTHLMNFGLNRNVIDDNEYKVPAVAIDGEANSVFNIALIPSRDSGLGTASFKFAYATRGLLHYGQEPSLKFAPGVSAFVDSFNSKVGANMSINKSHLEDISKGLIQLSRWVIDFMYHKQVLCSHDWHGMRRLVLDNQNNTSSHRPFLGPYDDRVMNLSCQTAKRGRLDRSFWSKKENVISITESDNRKSSMYRLTSCLHSPNNNLYGLERSKFRIYNILDLNIVPINFHALQREIPFTNIINYSYTFDHMVKNLIGVDTKTKPLQDIHGNDDYSYDEYRKTIYPEDTLVRHVMFPLGLRRVDEYTHNTSRIMSGNTSLSLNKPKFLSDQLWNKVLLNSLYPENVKDLNLARSQNVNNLYPYNTPIGAPAFPAIIPDPRFVNDVGEYLINTGIGNIGIIPAATPGLQISYIKKSGEITSVQTDIRTNEGYLRYQSKLIRWTEWFVQLQRVVRLLMRSQLEWVSDPVVQRHDAISEEVTEYKSNNVFDLGDFE